MQTITRYLETLRGAVDGDELHGIISRTLRRHSRKGPPGPEYLIDLYAQLEAYAHDALSLPNMRIRARLLQQHIGPYISDLKIESLHEAPAPAPAMRKPPSPSVAAVTAPAPEREEATPAIPIPTPELTPPPQTTATLLSPQRDSQPSPTPLAREAMGGELGAVEGVLERPGENEQAAAQERTEKYQALLRSEKDAWQAIYGTVKDYQRLKDAWLKSLEDLSRQRDVLEDRLHKTSEQLTTLEGEHDKLRAQLQNTRTESAKRPRAPALPKLLARAGTRAGALPKRDSFVRSVEAEIRRTKRSGAPLALGLIFVESLDTLTERHGEEATSAALRCYAEEVLSNFRAYDIVGVYDRDQFAVMFPDTSKEGARRALEKAYKRAVETHMNHSGRSIPLPPFAGALVTYSAGEDPGMFLGRAGEALSNARESGSRGVVLS